MKHTLKATITLVLFFFLAQLTGLLIVNQYIDHQKTAETQTVAYRPLPYNLERPEVENQSTSFIYVMVSILVGTGLLLLIIKTNKPLFWKMMFFISVLFTLTIAFSAFMNQYIAGILALAIAVLKLHKPNMLIQNLSEIFIYGGLAAFVVNIFNLFAAFALLIAVSIYDYISVYKTRHMIKLAKFQSKSEVFAGLAIPYESGKSQAKEKHAVKAGKAEHRKSMAILGGGDIGFTLIFAGVVMKGLMLKEAVFIGFLKTLIIPVFVTLALLVLLFKGEHGKFYPAMPVLSLGCFVGYFIVLLVSLV